MRIGALQRVHDATQHPECAWPVMLQLNKKTEYGLIALIHLADRDGQVVSAREISERYPVPKRLMAEVLKELCQHELVQSTRGATGGYMLARTARSITLGEVVSVLEGMPTLASCESLGLYQSGSCGVEPVCPIKSPIQRVRAAIWDVLQRTTLHDMSRAGKVPALAAPAPAPALAGAGARGREATDAPLATRGGAASFESARSSPDTLGNPLATAPRNQGV